MANNDLEKLAQARTEELVRINEEGQEEQRRLRQILEMYERDRQLTAYDIHDGFVQQATGALMNLQAYRSLADRDSRRGEQILDQAMRSLEAGISEARWLVSGLRPAILDDHGVVAAIEHLVTEAGARSDVDIEWSHDVGFDRLAPPLEMALFRIVQEGLSNAMRHSGSPRIRIQLTHEKNLIRVIVQDWGCGFDPAGTKPKHFGLQGIRERARVLGGESEIRSDLGAGTTISVVFPALNFESSTPAGGMAKLEPRAASLEPQATIAPSTAAAPSA